MNSSCEITSLRDPWKCSQCLSSHVTLHIILLLRNTSPYGKSSGLILKHIKPIKSKMYVTAITSFAEMAA